MKINEFIGMLFLARDVTHSAHLNTKSYAQHKALEDFYSSIIDLADTLAEAYQGRHGLMGQVDLMQSKKAGDPLDFLEDQMKVLEQYRFEVCFKTDTPIQNIIDEIISLYLSTLYKLRFLS